jgi:hypothetical protein
MGVPPQRVPTTREAQQQLLGVLLAYKALPEDTSQRVRDAIAYTAIRKFGELARRMLEEVGWYAPEEDE